MGLRVIKGKNIEQLLNNDLLIWREFKEKGIYFMCKWNNFKK